MGGGPPNLPLLAEVKNTQETWQALEMTMKRESRPHDS